MYKKTTRIHLIGIGGIGMSGIATILKYQGYDVSGCDIDIDQQSIRNLKAIGCKIYEGNNTPHCQNSADVIVYSSAINADNLEICNAQKWGIPTIPRAIMLAELMRTKYSIAVTGAHGKTTTTSLISHIFIEAGVDPTVIIGGHLRALSNNARFGNGLHLIAEADESDRSLLHLHPTFALVTNIDLEHVDTYQNLDDIKATFRQFLSNIPFYGKAFLCADDEKLMSLMPIQHIKTILYGTATHATVRAINIKLESNQSTYQLIVNQKIVGEINIHMPGMHNVLNSLGAIAVALHLDIPFSTIAQALTSFKGVERRFSYRGTFHNADVYEDYGHHPQEIATTIKAAQLSGKDIVMIFQPHRYSRTKALWHDFISCFAQSSLKHLIITDIYPAGEQTDPYVDLNKFIQEIKHHTSFEVSYLSSCQLTHLDRVLSPMVTQSDLVLLQGAGSIGKWWKQLVD